MLVHNVESWHAVPERGYAPADKDPVVVYIALRVTLELLEVDCEAIVHHLDDEAQEEYEKLALD